MPLFRAAVNTRMREGTAPAFPPSARDAIILGGTVFDLLGARARARRLRDARLAPAARGRRAGIELAFDARFRDIETEWRRHLREDMPRAGSLGELPDEAPF